MTFSAITYSLLVERMVRSVKLVELIPNGLSAARVIVSPFIVSLAFQGHWCGAFVLLVVAVVSDAVDGEVARKLRVASKLGQALDTTGDIAYSVAVLAGLFLTETAPSWFTSAIVCYAVIVIGRVVCSRGKAKRVLGCIAMPFWLTLLAYML